MNILIVDDEFYSADGIAQSIDWESIGITGVFKAYSMAQAQIVFEEQIIDILLTDIEMPKGSGIDLVTWVREKKYPCVCLFLTCYSEFEYANKAIQLKILDYILKPVQYDVLAQKLKQAATESVENKKKALKLLHGDFWQEEQRNIVTNLFHSVTEGIIPPVKDKLLKNLEKRHINADYSTRKMYMLLIRVLPDKDSENWDKSLWEYAFMNIVNELFSPLIIPKGNNMYLIFMAETDFAGTQAFRNHCSIAIPTMRTALPAEFCGYYDEPCEMYDFYATYHNLLDDATNNLSVGSTVFKHGEKAAADIIPEIQSKKWMDAIMTHNTDIIMDDIESILFSSQQKIIERNTLKIIFFNLINAINSALEAHRLPIHQPFINEEPDVLNKATSSVNDLIIWAQDISKETVEFLIPHEDSTSIIEQIRQYIIDNISGDISRGAIAGEVHLNPDYLSYLFREKTGISLSEFIVDERISAAKNLLLTTDLPINEIAIRTGFQSISYFSKQFKRAENKTPMQFRKKK